MQPKQMTIPTRNASSCTRLLTPSFSFYRFVVSRTSGAEYIWPLSSRTARLSNAGPAQAVTSHRPISKSWWGSRQETGTTARAGPAKACDAMMASAHHPAAQPRPGRRRRGGLDDGERAPPGGPAARAGVRYRHLFSMYRFVVSRTSGRDIFAPFLLERPGEQTPGRPKL